MKRTLFFAIIVMIACSFVVPNSMGQTIIDFEAVDVGYTPSTTFGSGSTDVFNRVNPNIGGNSTYFWAAEDISGNPSLTLDQISIVGATSFTFSIDFLTPNTNDWDSTDELLITYSVDGGGYQNLMSVQHVPNGGDLYNEPAALDLDFDGNGDVGQELPALVDGNGAGVGNTFQSFITSSIPLTGNSTLDISFQFNGLTSNDEGIYLDNITITQVGSGNNAPLISGITQTPSLDISSSTTVSVSADVTDSDGTVSNVELHWGTTPASLVNTINMSNAGGDTYTTDTDIPAQSGGTTVYYEVEATDDDTDVTTSSTFNYTVYPFTTTLPYSEDFTSDLGECYVKSVSGNSKQWVWDAGGYAYMNGYNSGDTEEDWLILPQIDFSSYSDVIMTFDTWYNWGSGDDADHYLKVFYSTDYPGVGDPSGSSWTELNYSGPSASETWTNSLVVDLSNITGSSVFIAFKYYYLSDSYREWHVDNISIYEGTKVDVTFQVDMADETVSGAGVHMAGSFSDWWNPAGIELLDGDFDDVYTTTLSLFSGEEYQFKYINGDAWGGDESVPASCQAPGTTNRFEIIGGSNYSLDEVCFGSCEDCGVLNSFDVTFRVDMKNETVGGVVNIAGSFNSWGDTPMTNTSGTLWEVTISLQETTYQEYKFKNGGTWENFDGSCLASSWGNRFVNVPSANTTLDIVCFNSCEACPVADFVIINEVDSDQSGTDANEFIELYDGGLGDTDLSGLVVVLFNGSDDQSYNDAIDLDGYSTDANGYFVIGSASVPNVDLASFTTNGLQNGADAVALFVGDGADFPNDTPVPGDLSDLLDALVYDTGDSDDPALLALLNPGQPQIDEQGRGNGSGHSNQRILNGTGGQRNTDTYDQSPPTPGEENVGIYTDWTGVVDGNWDEAGNWHNGVPTGALNAEIPDVSGAKAPFPAISGTATCLNLYMAAGSALDINPTGELTVTGTFTNSGGTLTIKSDATGTGSLIESSGVNANVQRYLVADRWHFISSPITAATANTYLGLYLQYYDEPNQTWVDITEITDPLNVGVGYSAWTFTNPYTASYSGTLNAGATVLPVTNAGNTVAPAFKVPE